MIISLESITPIYIQIAQGIENDILNGILIEDESAYSQYQIAKEYSINPATAAKGINILVQEGTLYKKRGLGMFVSAGAKESIKKKHRDVFLSTTIKESIQEAIKLGITKQELNEIINSLMED